MSLNFKCAFISSIKIAFSLVQEVTAELQAYVQDYRLDTIECRKKFYT